MAQRPSPSPLRPALAATFKVVAPKQTVKKPKPTRRSGSLPPDGEKLVSDGAPEAACLSSSMWLLPAPRSTFFPARMRLSGKAATVLGSGPRMTGLRVRLGQSPSEEVSAIAWPVAREVPAGWCTIPTGTLARGMGSVVRLSRIPAVCFAPPSGVFATARAPCLCASEARPSDQGIQVLEHPTPSPSSSPSSGGRPLQAGRDFVPATAHRPGAGPASPDIASPGVSEGGTG